MSSTRKRYRILMVEDSRVSLEVYAQRLEKRGYRVATAISAEEARAELEAGVPDLILLDVFMPKVSGFEFLRELRGDPKTSRVPIILISALSDTQHIVEGLELGANDYVTKPIVMPILTARMEALLRSSELVRRLEVQTELLSKLAAFDDLTGVYNRRSMFHHLEAELSRCRRYGRSLGILMVDIDHFKRVNDEHGHLVGDQALRWVATTLQNELRSMDFLCRYGGEEFCAILPETNRPGVARAGERLRAAIERTLFKQDEVQLSLSISLGGASWAADESNDIPDLLARADAALLEAKRNGRNQVRVSNEDQVARPS
ncbi:MAG TPA: diguanylate cyclase [Polyangiaceae bacterium]|nr:diguanylate cyclase [Polyangiaceae bacterium]